MSSFITATAEVETEHRKNDSHDLVNDGQATLEEQISVLDMCSSTSASDAQYVMQSSSNEGTGWMKRDILCADSINWMKEKIDFFPGCVFTSLPDITEIHDLFPNTTLPQRIDLYKEWFIEAVYMILLRLQPHQCAIFIQSDARVTYKGGQVESWIDKSFLCQMAASRLPASHACVPVWHKVALVRQVDSKCCGRPSYSHVLCMGRDVHYNTTDFQAPDVFPRGEMVWEKGVGVHACIVALSFIKYIIGATIVTDPFCGVGTTCALANMMQLDSVGVDISKKRTRKAELLNLKPYWDDISDVIKVRYGCPRVVKEKKEWISPVAYYARDSNDEEANDATADGGISEHCVSSDAAGAAVDIRKKPLHHYYYSPGASTDSLSSFNKSRNAKKKVPSDTTGSSVSNKFDEDGDANLNPNLNR